MLTKFDILCKNYLLLQFYFFTIWSYLITQYWIVTHMYILEMYDKFKPNYGNSWFSSLPIFQIQHLKWSQGGHLLIVVVVKIIISLWKSIFKVKQVALSYSFQYWLFPNSQYDQMHSYSRIQQPSASFSAANISRMALGMSCINKYSLLTHWLVINTYINAQNK